MILVRNFMFKPRKIKRLSRKPNKKSSSIRKNRKIKIKESIKIDKNKKYKMVKITKEEERKLLTITKRSKLKRPRKIIKAKAKHTIINNKRNMVRRSMLKDKDKQTISIKKIKSISKKRKPIITEIEKAAKRLIPIRQE